MAGSGRNSVGVRSLFLTSRPGVPNERICVIELEGNPANKKRRRFPVGVLHATPGPNVPGSSPTNQPQVPTAPQAVQKSQPSLRITEWLPHSLHSAPCMSLGSLSSRGASRMPISRLG